MVATIDISSECPYCHQPISVGTEALVCPLCGASYHRECWEEHKGCQTEGCAGVESIAPDMLIAQKKPAIVSIAALHLPWIIGVGIGLVLLLAAFIAVMLGARLNTVLIVSVVVAALAFDYVNGMHDAGNAIATVISTRVLTPATALVMAGVLNLCGALVFTGVAASIATKFADMHQLFAYNLLHPHHQLIITQAMILTGLLGASGWSFITARLGVPVSTSHSLFGGLIGVFLLGNIPLNMSYLGKIGTWMVLAPLCAFSAGWLLMIIIMWIFRYIAPHKINKHFRVWQIFSSALMAFSHGSNDAQKAMGIITMALWAYKLSAPVGALHTGIRTLLPAGEGVVPIWVKCACALVIGVGTGIGGMRVIKTLGTKIIKLAPVHGFTAEIVAATTIQIVTFMKIPISTTHVISSSILGIGASKRLSAVRWGVASNIVLAWVFTIPTCALAGALLYAIVRRCGLT